MTSHFLPTYECRRMDLTRTALVFGGLLLTATVLCSAMEASGVSQILDADEVKVLRNENVIGPEEQNPVALNCDPADDSVNGSAGSTSGHGSTKAMRLRSTKCREPLLFDRSNRRSVH